MKKIGICVLCGLCILIISVTCCIKFNFTGGINNQEPYPKDGIFYCDELKMEIDFSKAEHTSHCACLYDENDNSSALQVLITMGGNTLIIVPENDFESETTYLRGTYKWQGDEFCIDSTYSTVFRNKTYFFIRR